jgi:hypothetical protein
VEMVQAIPALKMKFLHTIKALIIFKVNIAVHLKKDVCYGQLSAVFSSVGFNLPIPLGRQLSF